MKYICLIWTILWMALSVPARGQDTAQAEGPGVLIIGEVTHLDPLEPFFIKFHQDYLANIHLGANTVNEQLDLEAGTIFHGSPNQRASLFQWSLPRLDGPAYFTLYQDRNYVLDRYLIFPGDTVQVKMDLLGGQVIFAGPSAAHFRCQYELRLAKETARYRERPHMTVDHKDQILQDSTYAAQYRASRDWPGRKVKLVLRGEQEVERIEKLIGREDGERAAILERYRPRLSPEVYGVLSADLWADRRVALLSRIRQAYFFARSKQQGELQEKLESLFYGHFPGPAPEGFAVRHLARSSRFMDYLTMWGRVKAMLDSTSLEESLSAISPSTLRDRALGAHLVLNFDRLRDPSEYIHRNLETIGDPAVRELFAHYRDGQLKGGTPGDFAFQDLSGKEVKLSDFRGELVLLNFWFTGCKASAWYYREILSKVEAHFKGREGFRILSVSTDRDPEVWKGSVQGGGPTSPDLVNLYTNGKGARHPFLAENGIKSYPNQRLVSPGGRLLVSGRPPADADQLIGLIERELETISSSKP